MDKNQPFFDPYNFNMQSPIQQNNQMDPTLNGLDNLANPMIYYEQQYMYYRYLTQLLEYKIKLKEWEKMNNNSNNN